MPIESIKLRPGVNADFTPALNEGGWSDSNLIRFKEGQPQKVGGWEKFYDFSVASPVKALHAWQDLNQVDHLAEGSVANLGVITDGALTTITPQTYTSSFLPNFGTTSGSASVLITDTNISNVTTFDAVYFDTPVSVGGVVLSGLYPIDVITGATSYRITASTNATSTRATKTISGATQANPCVITAVAHGYSNGQLVFIAGVGGMTQLNGRIFTIANVTTDTFELSGVNSTGYSAYTSGGSAYCGIVPQFATSSGSATVTVTLPAHGLSAGGRATFPISTTVGGVTIDGTYQIITVPDVNTFTITASSVATSTSSAIMNSGSCQLVYYIALGPAASGSGYSIGGYGTGGYSTGSTSSVQTGTQITATDWTLDNWGKTLLSCPDGGGLYYWDPDGGFLNASLISTDNAPLFNTGMFIAQPAQIMVAYGSTTQRVTGSLGVYQDPLLIRWCDQDNYLDWAIDTDDQVGSVRIPRGSKIVAGIQAPNQALIWTDIAVWSMQYVSQPLVFATNEIGSGCGLIAKHAVAVLRSTVFWMSADNFYILTPSGSVEALPCTVWDYVFQDLDTTNQGVCAAWSNSLFNEVWFFFPSTTDGTGQNSRYVKFNLTEKTWDKGILARSVGIDQSVLGSPIAATSTGFIYSHETGNNADGVAMNAYAESGEFLLSDGSLCMFVDQIRPNMNYGFDGQPQTASMTVTVTTINDADNSVQTSGPMTYTEATTYLTPRVRGHRAKIRIESNDVGSWWRLGRMRFRVAPDGKF